MTINARAIALSIAALAAVAMIVLVRRGGPNEAPPPTSKVRTDDSQRSPVEICDSLLPTLRRMPSTSLGAARLVDLDSAWSGAGKRPACQVAGNIGPIVSEFTVADSLEGWLDAAGWRTNTVYAADGPDGHVASRYRNGATCILSFHWDGPDDGDTTATTAAVDSMKVELTCAATVPADTMTR
jgi:hypothetical protein